jgi:hypothetical protein
VWTLAKELGGAAIKQHYRVKTCIIAVVKALFAIGVVDSFVHLRDEAKQYNLDL